MGRFERLPTPSDPQDPADIDTSVQDVVIQHYVSNPLLVHGHKFDLRIYVAVTCLDPLRVYVYQEGAQLAGAVTASRTRLPSVCQLWYGVTSGAPSARVSCRSPPRGAHPPS